MKKYLVISTVGDNSLHYKWIENNPEFDLVLIYYGEKENIIEKYTQHAQYMYVAKGEKYHLIKSLIVSSPELISKYSYIWLPDDDVYLSTEDINNLFKLAEEYDLYLCQPSMKGYVSHEITLPKPNSLLRYTNFVEILAPLMNLKTLMLVKDIFNENYSGWGYDFLWPYMLNYPEDKIAIIDAITMTHTKPVGTDYSRFPVLPGLELERTIYKLAPDLILEQKEYKTIQYEVQS
jgi:hypothetical protein